MADRFWVGNSGNWSDAANHWSATSGGTPGATKPGTTDNVYFDVNSFTIAGQTVTVDETASCLDMGWVGSVNAPTLTLTSGQFLLYGSLTLISDMTFNKGTMSIFLKAASAGKTITTCGKQLYAVQTDDANGGWTLQDNLSVYYTFNHAKGTFNTNDKSIDTTIGTFSSNTGYPRTLTLGSSVITCGSNITFANTSMTLNANTSTFKMTGASKTFSGANLTFNNVEFLGTPTTIAGSNTFNKITVASGKTLNLTADTTQTISRLIADGATVKSLTAGTPATIAVPSGDIVVHTTTLQDITATGTFYAIRSSVNTSGNTGITFTDRIFRGNIIQPDEAMSDTSTNTVQNKVIKAYIDGLIGDIETILAGM